MIILIMHFPSLLFIDVGEFFVFLFEYFLSDFGDFQLLFLLYLHRYSITRITE
jgi:hypothetical protein